MEKKIQGKEREGLEYDKREAAHQIKNVKGEKARLREGLEMRI